MIAAGTSQFTTEGTNKTKNSSKAMIPFCHTISVVMSPKGLKAPPALAATTTLMHAITTKGRLAAPIATTTVAIKSAVVRLSAIGERTNAMPPVTQKILR